MATNNVKCESPKCIQAIEKFGERCYSIKTMYRPAPSFMPDAIAICERCGGYYNGERWMYQCLKCGKEVRPGELVGLFVPHHCKECEQAITDENRRRGNVCRMCRQPRNQCCC